MRLFVFQSLTGQRKHFVTNVDGRIMLSAVQRILTPGAQKFLHGQLLDSTMHNSKKLAKFLIVSVGDKVTW